MQIPDSDALIEDGPSTSKPYLGSPAVVDGILRHVLYDITAARRAQLEQGTDVTPIVLAQAENLQRIFYGQDGSYQAFAWNSPRHLGRALVESAGIGGSTDDAVKRASVRMIRDFVQDMVAHEEGRLAEAQFHAAIDALLSKFTRIFVGSGDAA